MGGVPVLLVAEAVPTIAGATVPALASLLSETSGEDVASEPAPPGTIDPYVQQMVAGTNGNLYRGLIGKLTRYPVPELPLPEGRGATMLDVGCGWGRWSIASARRGYAVTGVDPVLRAVLAARRVSVQLALRNDFYVADARHLPFPDASFDVCFSYSVLQHFSGPDAREALGEIARVLKPGGRVLVQMANALGVRSSVVQAKRGFREAREFEVRYWRPAELRAMFSAFEGVDLSVDGYFGLGLQAADVDLLPLPARTLVRTSEALRRVSRRVRPLTLLADSLWISGRRRAG